MEFDKEKVETLAHECLSGQTFDLKKKQLEVLWNILNGKDVLTILPTGYGKSLIYQLLPKLSKILNICENPVVVVVSPLVALIQDQVEAANTIGFLDLKAVAITQIKDFAPGKANLLFGTPETWLNPKWKEVLASPYMVENLICLVVDEVHKVSWGASTGKSQPFRESFGRIGELRSHCRQDLPVLAMSATVDSDLTELIIGSCSLSKSMKVVSTFINRENIRLSVIRIPKRDLSCLDWLIQMICELKEKSPKALIFCRSVNLAGFLYHNLTLILSKTLNNFREYIGLFHSETLDKNKNKVLDSLVDSNSEFKIRLVVATSSLGCGVNMKGVKYVVHYGPAYHLTDYCQQIGRAGRDSNDLCEAILYNFNEGGNLISRSMKSYIKSSTESCLRVSLYTPFNDNANEIKSSTPLHNCCSFCRSKCDCGEEACQNHSIIKEDEETVSPIREVTKNDEEAIIEILLELHSTHSKNCPMMLAPSGLVTGITPSLINTIIKHLPFVDSVAYIEKKFNLKWKLSNDIAIAIKEIFSDSDIENMYFKDVSYDEDVEMHKEDVEMQLDDLTLHDTEFSDYSFDSDESVTSLSDSDFEF